VFTVAAICINVAAGVIIVQAVRGISYTGHRHSDEAGADERGGAGAGRS
jgi:hypothetical protein